MSPYSRIYLFVPQREFGVMGISIVTMSLEEATF